MNVAVARLCNRGQSMFEYVVALAILVAIVSVPMGERPSLIAFFLAAVHDAYQRFFVAIASPF